MDQDELNELLLPHTINIARCTIPFFGDFPDKKDTFGSGVLLRVASSHFILTAAHVADYLSDKDVGVYLPGPSIDSPEKAILCKASKIVKSKPPKEGSRWEDNIDVAVIELEEEVAEKLASFMRFLSLSDFELNPEKLKDGIFAFVGYPESRNDVDDAYRVITAEVLPYLTHLLPSSHRDYNPSIHVSLSIHEEYDSGGDQYGLDIQKLGNISGCGIWRLADEGVPVQSFDWKNFRQVALLHTRYDNPDVVVGTKLKAIVKTLWQEFEATQNEIMRTIPREYLL